MELVFLDTETTGNDPVRDRLCQVSYKAPAGIRTGYFKPPLLVSTKAMSITHITNRMLADKPPFSGSALAEELAKLLRDGVMVAHNAAFDAAMLGNEGVAVPRMICTLKLVRHLDADGAIPEYKLQYLRYHYDLEVSAGSAHDAEADVLVLEALFGRLRAELEAQEGISGDAAVARMIEITGNPVLCRKFTFGKYSGAKVEDVARTDPGYLEWLLAQKLANEVRDEDWIHTLQHYLGR